MLRLRVFLAVAALAIIGGVVLQQWMGIAAGAYAAIVGAALILVIGLLDRSADVPQPRPGAAFPPGGIQTAIQQLKKFTSGAETILVADPYLLRNCSWRRLLEVVGVLGGQLKVFVAVTDPQKDDPAIVACVRQECARCGCSFLKLDHDGIHDRVWIKDGEKALLAGTSFNGFGWRFSFIVDLPEEDCDEFLAYLINCFGSRLREVCSGRLPLHKGGDGQVPHLGP
jgi:hypothetical protein